MLIKIDSLGDSSEAEIDVDEILEEFDISDVESLYSAIVWRVAHHTMKAGCEPEDAWANTFEHEGHELDPHHYTGSLDVWKEIAQLCMWLHSGGWNGVEQQEYDYLPIFASIQGQHWKFFSFDDIEGEKENYSQEFDGDYDEFGREWMSELGEGLPDNLEYYFDYEAYGRDIIEGYTQYEYENVTYLFHE